MFMHDHKTFFLTYSWKLILVEYNQDQGKSFSFKDYLLYLLQADTWGDELSLSAISIMWNMRVTVIFPLTLSRYNIRHNQQDLKLVEIIVINSGGLHYTAVGKGRFRI